MDLRKKTDSLGTSFNVKTEYIEEDVENVMKNDFSEIQTPSVVSTIPPSRYLGQHSPQAPEGAAGHMFTPFTHPFYHPISAFSFVSLPPSLPAPVSYPTFRDVLESNHNESYNYKRKSPSSIRDANKKLKEKSPESNNHQEKQEKEKDTKHEESSGKAKISCPVCGDTAVAHFHYGGMCCYSCKAFFRRVVNTYKVTKYTCRSGTGQCDVSLANRRSCQACRYKKCIAAGMKPGLVLSDDQCNKRFGMKKDEPNPEAAPPVKKSEETVNEDVKSHVIENEYAVLIDSEKSYEEQVKIGRPLFVSLLTIGTVSKIGNDLAVDNIEEDDKLTRDDSGLSEALGMMISFQTDRQLNNARKFVPFKKIFSHSGRLNTGDILNTLIQHIVLLMKQNKYFKSLSVEDQAELCQANVMVAIVLSSINLYSAKNSSLTWPGSPPVTFTAANILPLLDPDVKEEIPRLAKFLDSFAKLDIPRSVVNLLIFVSMFSSEFCVLEDKEAVTEARTRYIHLVYDSLCHNVGVRKSCTLASKLHLLLQNLDRICQILGQKFVNVS